MHKLTGIHIDRGKPNGAAPHPRDSGYALALHYVTLPALWCIDRVVTVI